MTVLPVIVRELRAEARHAFNYWLRVLGALALLFVTIVMWLDQGFSAQGGGKLFGNLNTTLFFSIWILVPMLTADCISREKREGTIGLLFLTPLKALDIVIAKGLVHGVRAMTLLLAVLPVLVLPFLIGGVGWKEALLSVMTNLSSLFLALSAGLLASSRARRWLRALLLAELIGGFFLFAFAFVYGCAALPILGRFFPSGISMPRPVVLAAVGFLLCADFGGGWAELLSALPAASQSALLRVAASMMSLSLLTTALVVIVAAHRLRRKWQEEPPSAQQLWWYNTFCTPHFWVDSFRRFMQRRMERNPIGWLQERTWSARLITWVWFGLVMSLYSLAFGVGVYDDGFRSFQTFLACGLVLNMAFSASGSFRRERETGLLELMLVAPLSVRQIMWGRVRGIWSQFGPAILLLLALWIYVGLDFGYWLQGHKRGWFNQFWFFTTTFLTLPVIGLYFSLRYQNFLIATIASLTIGCLLPLGLAAVMLVTTQGLYLSCFYEILLAWFLGRLLVRNLTSRTFAFQRAGA